MSNEAALGLADLPNEILFCIIRFCLAVGREADASALARTNRELYGRLNTELYKLVIKHRTFHVLHWAARDNQMETLKKALANGADPNDMWRTGITNVLTSLLFRPAGWGLNTAEKLDRAVLEQFYDLKCPHINPFPSLDWTNTWFSSSSLSLANPDHLTSLRHHYLADSLVMKDSTALEVNESDDEMRLHYLLAPPDDSVTFPENMSHTDMDGQDVKLGFVRLFRYWCSPLHVAALKGRAEIAEVLLAHGAEIDSTSVQGCFCPKHMMPSSVAGAHLWNQLVAYTPLHIAICMREFETAKVLVTHGAQQMAMVFSGDDDRTWVSENALHRALSITRDRARIDYDFIEFLLKNGYADRLKERNHENLTPLLIACNTVNVTEQHGVIELLLRYGAEIENQGPRSPRTLTAFPEPDALDLATPALWAAWKGQFRLSRLLLERGADMCAKSSVTRVRMLHAVCSGRYNLDIPEDSIGLLYESRERFAFLDYLLDRCGKRDINAFDAKQCTPLTLLIRWSMRRGTGIDVKSMIRTLFVYGADILAGAAMGKETPFEIMIAEGLTMYSRELPVKTTEAVGEMVLFTTRASKIHQNRYRPQAFLNRFWGYLDKALRKAARRGFFWRQTVEVGPRMLHGLIQAGFSPGEVDRHGDTAMTSFLKHLLKNPALAVYDKFRIGTQGWHILSIMALLQENGAALHVRNNDGFTAFDYFRKIIGYEGEQSTYIMLSRVVAQQVRVGRDERGKMCFKFHPSKCLFADFLLDDTPRKIRDNPSRWLVCEHWCRYNCGSSRAANGSCRCARTSFQTFANCDGDCCLHRDDRTRNLLMSGGFDMVQALAMASGLY